MAKKNPLLVEDQSRCLDVAVCISSGASQRDSSGNTLPPAYSVYITVPSYKAYKWNNNFGEIWGQKITDKLKEIPELKIVGETGVGKDSERTQFYITSDTESIVPWIEMEKTLLKIFDTVSPEIMPEASYVKWREDLLKNLPSKSQFETAQELNEKLKAARAAVKSAFEQSMPSNPNAGVLINAVADKNIYKILTLKDKDTDFLPEETQKAIKEAKTAMKEYTTNMMKLTEVWTGRMFLPFIAPFAVSYAKGTSYGSQQQEVSFSTAEEYYNILRRKAFSETFAKDILKLAQNAVLSVKEYPMSPYRIGNAAPHAALKKAPSGDKQLQVSLGWAQGRLNKPLVDEFLAQVSGHAKNPIPAVRGLFKSEPEIDDRSKHKDGAAPNDPYGMDKLYSIYITGTPVSDQSVVKANYLLSKLFGKVQLKQEFAKAKDFAVTDEDKKELNHAAEIMQSEADLVRKEQKREKEEKAGRGTTVANRVVPVGKGAKLFIQIADGKVPQEVLMAVDELKKQYPDSFGAASVVANSGTLYSSLYINAPSSSEAVGFSHRAAAAEFLKDKINELYGEDRFKVSSPDDKIGIEVLIRGMPGTEQKRLCVKYPLVAKEGGVVESILEGVDEPEDHPGYETKDPVSNALWSFHNSFGRTARENRKYERDPERKEYLKKFEMLEKFVPAKAQLEKHTNTIAFELSENQAEAEEQTQKLKELIGARLTDIAEQSQDANAVRDWLSYKWMPDTSAKAMKDINNDIKKHTGELIPMLLDAAQGKTRSIETEQAEQEQFAESFEEEPIEELER